MNEDYVKLAQRLKNSGDGKDFINYLQELSLVNYKAWKLEGGDILRGKAIAIDELILFFENADVVAKEISKPDPLMGGNFV